MVLELKGGGKTTVTLMGQTVECTYQTPPDQVAVTGDGDEAVCTVHGDGSLTGPPGGIVGTLRKRS